MKHYQFDTPRVSCALAALAITTLTFSLFVVVPAEVESGRPGATIEARQAVPAVAPAAIVASLPAY